MKKLQLGLLVKRTLREPVLARLQHHSGYRGSAWPIALSGLTPNALEPGAHDIEIPKGACDNAGSTSFAIENLWNTLRRSRLFDRAVPADAVRTLHRTAASSRVISGDIGNDGR